MTLRAIGIPGIDSESVTPLPLAGGLVVGEHHAQVRAPYGGQLLGAVPALGVTEVARAVADAKRALRDEPLPQWRRAEILDKAAALLQSRREDFARCIALEAAKPIRTARAEVDRAASTMLFSAAVARSLAGDVVPLEASPGGRASSASFSGCRSGWSGPSHRSTSP
jgi:acyl-CoA reductase-like NAD-dependent aldehyde dehydrogenase